MGSASSTSGRFARPAGRCWRCPPKRLGGRLRGSGRPPKSRSSPRRCRSPAWPMPRSTASIPTAPRSPPASATMRKAISLAIAREGPETLAARQTRKLGRPPRLGAAALRRRFRHHDRDRPRRPAARDRRAAGPCRCRARPFPSRRPVAAGDDRRLADRRAGRARRVRSHPNRRGTRSASTSAGRSRNGARMPKPKRRWPAGAAISSPPPGSWSCSPRKRRARRPGRGRRPPAPPAANASAARRRRSRGRRRGRLRCRC